MYPFYVYIDTYNYLYIKEFIEINSEGCYFKKNEQKSEKCSFIDH